MGMEVLLSLTSCVGVFCIFCSASAIGTNYYMSNRVITSSLTYFQSGGSSSKLYHDA